LPQAQQAEIGAVPSDSVAETMVRDFVEAEGCLILISRQTYKQNVVAFRQCC